MFEVIYSLFYGGYATVANNCKPSKVRSVFWCVCVCVCVCVSLPKQTYSLNSSLFLLYDGPHCERFVFVFMQLWACTGVAGVGCVLATFGVCSSTPPSPPTSSAAASSEAFLTGLKKVGSLTMFCFTWFCTNRTRFNKVGSLTMFCFTWFCTNRTRFKKVGSLTMFYFYLVLYQQNKVQ